MLICYLIWQKKVIENRDKSKKTKYLIFNIFCQRETIHTFSKKLINLKLISEFVPSDKSVFSFLVI